MNYRKYIEENTIRYEAGYRGGGIEIDLSDFLCKDGVDYADKYEGYKMTAYQNYLGGGMLGKICHDYNFDITKLSKKYQTKVEKMTEELKKYFHSLTNHSGDEWEDQTYIQNQNMPISAY